MTLINVHDFKHINSPNKNFDAERSRLYCEQLEKGKRAIEFSEELNPLARAGEIAAFGLRMNAGWPLLKFKQRTGFDLQREWQTEIQQMIKLGYAHLDECHFQLTSRGLRYADWAAEKFLRI